MKTSWAALLVSASIHTFAGYAFWAAGGISNPVPSKEPIPIQISYLPAEAQVQPKPVEVRKPKTEAPKAKKINIPAEVKAVKVPAKPKAVAAPVVVAPSSAIKASADSPPAAPRTASDFMGDPQKGKIFMSYFGQLKEKIQLNLRRRYRGGGDIGVVTLFFVLNPDGSLVKANVVANRSDAGPELRNVALDSLKRAAPFGPFPKDLGNGAVAFSLKVFFDELD